MAKGMYVAKGYSATGSHPQTKAAVNRAQARNSANQQKAARTVITAPSFKVARNRTDT